MDMYKTFVTNSENLEETFEAIRGQATPQKFDKLFLQKLGYEKPDSVLYVKLFKRLGLVKNDGRPSQPYYNKFIESDKQARKLIAKLVRKQYAKIFEEDDYPYHRSNDELYALFRKQMGGKKSKTIVKLVADTFKALTDYADTEFINKNTQGAMTVEYDTHNNNGSKKKTDNPHEEFIVELINNDPHDYSQNGSDSNNGELLEELVDEKEEASACDTDTNQPETEKEVDSDRIEPTNGRGNGKAEKQGIFLTKALIRRAELLEKLDRQKKAITAYNDIISYSEEKEGLFDDQKIATAYYKKACMLEQVDKYEEAVAAYDKLIQRFG